MIQSIHKETYKVNSINVNSNQRLGLIGILGFLQDAASEHAQASGFGFDDMLRKNIFWVLIRQNIRMYQWPKWQDKVIVETWPTHFQGLYAYREFVIFVDNEKIGECSTTWMILDGKTRRPIKTDFLNDEVATRENLALDFTAEKVDVSGELSWSKKFKVRNSDIDMNKHVNNIKYAQWVLDAIPFEYHQTHVVNEFEINFTAETMLGDTVICHYTLEPENSEMIFKGNRESDEKMVFAAKVVAEKIV